MALDDILKDIEERKVANPPVRRNVYVADLNMNVNTDLETPDEINYATKTQVLNKPKQEYMGLKECENPFKSVYNASVDSLKNVLDKVIPESIKQPAKEWAKGVVATGVSLGNLSWGATKIFSSEFAMGSETLKQQRVLEQSYMRREITQEEYSKKLQSLLSKREKENSLMREDIAQEVRANNQELNKWLTDMGFGPDTENKTGQFFYNLGSANVSMLFSLGAFALTKNPMLSIALLSTPEFTSGYLQAIEEGKSADDAMKSGAENFFWTAGTEYIGTKVLFSTLSKSTKLNEGAKKLFAKSPRISMTTVAGLEEGTQEAIQSVGTDLIYKFNDISDLQAIDIIKNASNDFLFAFLSGAMIGGVTSNVQYDRIVKDTTNKLVALKDSKGQNLYTKEQAEQVAKETANLAMSNDIIEEVTGMSRNERDNSLSKEARNPKEMKKLIEENLKKMETALPVIKKELMDIKEKTKASVLKLGVDEEQATMVAEMTQARAMMYYNAFGITPLQFYYLNELEITVDENSNILSNGRETGYTVRFNESKVSQAIDSGNIQNVIQSIRTKENLDKFGNFVNKLVAEGKVTEEQRSMIYSQLADRMAEIPTTEQVVDRVREEEVDKFNQPAYTGSPVDHDGFSTDYIGTGEGALAHGWGLYSAQLQETAEGYRLRLTIDAVPKVSSSKGIVEERIGKILTQNMTSRALHKAVTENDMSYAKKDIEMFLQDLKNELEDYNSYIENYKFLIKKIEDSIKQDRNITREEFLGNLTEEEKNKKIYSGILDTVLTIESSLKNVDIDFARTVNREKAGPKTTDMEYVLGLEKNRLQNTEETLKWKKSNIEKIENIDLDTLKIERQKGQVFKIDIPEDDVLLDEDKYFSEQPKNVQDALTKIGSDLTDEQIENLGYNSKDKSQRESAKKHYKDMVYNATGKGIYETIIDLTGGDTEQASKLLNKYGVKGITYEGYRDGRCYVIFDDKAIKVLEKFYQGERGEAIPRDINTPVTEQTKSIIRVFSGGDRSTIIHEMAHIFLRDIEIIENQGGVQDEQFKKIKKTLDNWLGKKEGQKYTTEQQEKFAQGFETYMATGQAPKEELKGVFDYFKKWMSDIYGSIKNMIPITPEVKNMFDEILTLQPTNNTIQTQTEGGNGGGGNIINTPPTQDGGGGDIVPVTGDAKDLGKIKKKRSFVKGLFDIALDAIEPVSTRLGGIDTRLEYELKMFEARLSRRSAIYKNESLDFLKQTDELKKANKQDYLNYDRALKNGDIYTINRINNKYPKLKPAYEKVRKMLDNIKADLSIYGIGAIDNYFPRRVMNVDGLLSYLEGTDDWSIIERAMKQKDPNYKSWTEAQRAEFVASWLSGYGQTITNTTTNTKPRKIETITDEMDRYYWNSNDALLSYINDISNVLEVSRLLKLGQEEIYELGEVKGGRKSRSKKVSTDVKAEVWDNGYIDLQKVLKNIDSVLGKHISKLLQDKKISREQEQQIRELLGARFNFKNSNIVVSTLKSLGYMATLSNLTATVTQFGDLAYSIDNAGILGTLKAIFGKKEILMQELGIDHPAEDIKDNIKTMDKIISAIFKGTLFTYVDRLGKNTFIATTFMKYKNMIAKDEQKAFDDIARRYGEDFAKDVIHDIKNNIISENIYYFAHCELARVQPISLSEVPKEYLTHPVLRIAYSLKTFWIKQFNRIITDNKRLIQEGIKEKNAEKVKEGALSMARLIILFTILGTGTDVLKDLMSFRDIDFDLTTLDNLLKLIGISRYTVYKMREDGFGNTMGDLIMNIPVFQILDGFTKELPKVANGKMKLKDLKLFNYMPYIGQPYYWWLGGGRTKEKKKNKRRVL